MYKFSSAEFRSAASMFLLVITGAGLLFLWLGHKGLSLLDEGFLWYGAQRVMVGEVPIRDFMAYDIGRYYWSAAFMNLLGSPGIVALRVAIALFQVVALFVGLIVLIRGTAKQNIIFWVLSLAILLVWMGNLFRSFDIAMPIILVGALSFLIEKPTLKRYFLAGLVVGIAAVIGRNHGLYGALGNMAVMVYLLFKHYDHPRLFAAFSAWLSGVVIGYLPVFLLLLFAPGFAQAFWDSIAVLFEIKATNFPLPVPWPWLVPFGEISMLSAIRGVLVGILFLAVLVFVPVSIIWLILRLRKSAHAPPVLIATVFLALPYAHYAFSRADVPHLASGVPPLLMGVIVLAASQPVRIKYALIVAILAICSIVMLPAYQLCLADQSCVETKIAGDVLQIDKGVAKDLDGLSKLVEQFAPDGRSFIVAPFWPGAYAVLQRKSPMWEIYISFSRSEALQQAEVNRIKAAHPGFAVIHDYAMDGRNDLRFSVNRPIINRYLMENFEVLASRGSITIYKSKPMP